MDRDEDQLAPSEQARERRRDRDTAAKARAGMRTGLAKQFKQVLDTQRRRADEARDGAGRAGPETPPYVDDESSDLERREGRRPKRGRDG